MKDILKIGDEVTYQPFYMVPNNPAETIVKVKVTSIEMTRTGKMVDSIPWENVVGNEVAISLEIGRWGYGFQISKSKTLGV